MIVSVGKKHKITPSPGCSALSDLIALMNKFSIKHEHFLFAELSRDEKDEKEKRRKGEPYFQFEVCYIPNTHVYIDAPNYQIFDMLSYMGYRFRKITSDKILEKANLHMIFDKNN